jgi:aquaporin Z
MGLMAMIYMGGHVSGAHYNPAVTLSLMMRDKIRAADALTYCVFQLAGGLVAAVTSWWLVGRTFAPAPGAGVSTAQALAVESIFTFALVIVVLNVAATKATSGNSYYGLAIGLMVFAGTYSGASISGGAFNPAVGTGLVLVDSIGGGGSLSHLWLYLIGPCAGAALAAVVHRIQTE